MLPNNTTQFLAICVIRVMRSMTVVLSEKNQLIGQISQAMSPDRLLKTKLQLGLSSMGLESVQQW